MAKISVGLAGCFYWITMVAQAQLADPLPDIPLGVEVRLESFASGLPVSGVHSFNQVGPTDLAEIPNGTGNLVVTTYSGVAYLFDSAGNQQSSPFVDLSDPASATRNTRFWSAGAQGFTSIAFHPEFNISSSLGHKKFYTLEAEFASSGTADFDGSLPSGSVVTDNHHQEVLYEYSLTSANSLTCDATCAATKRELIRVTQPGWHHNLGDLAFDRDNFLYVSSGDGNTVLTNSAPYISENSTLLTNIFGKILRIDPSGTNSANGKYGIPIDNPFADGPGGDLDEIYAYGLRNPYRISFDPRTGDLYASETGEFSIESVNQIIRSGNHGWNLKEGSFLYDPTTSGISIDTDGNGNGIGDVADANNLVESLFEYDRDDGRAVIGGVVYRDTDIPGLDGHYVFGEWTSRLFYGNPQTGEAFEFNVDPTGEALPFRIHSINQDLTGGLYVLGVYALGESNHDGVIVRVAPDLETHAWTSVAPDGSWGDAANWDAADGSPDWNWDAVLNNVSVATGQTAVVVADSAVNTIDISGTAGPMTVLIEKGVTLTAFGDVSLQPGGVLKAGGTVLGNIINNGGTVIVGLPETNAFTMFVWGTLGLILFDRLRYRPRFGFDWKELMRPHPANSPPF